MKTSKKITKEEIRKEIEIAFSGKPTQKEIKKIKKSAMSKNIKLGELRKKFCKKCLSFFTSDNSETRVKKGIKIIKCKNCGHVNRWWVKTKTLI